MADVLFRHLEGLDFEFYYETFSEQDNFLPEAGDNVAVKQALLRKFDLSANPDEDIWKAF